MMGTQFIEANGLRFGYLSLGQGPLVICIHGFPDTAHSFQPLMHHLSAQGYRVVAPFSRGYAPTEVLTKAITKAPTDMRYSMEDFGKDALALIDAFGESRAYLVGHDWGASAVYAACSLAPEKVIRAVTAAVPHPNALKMSGAQLRKSWYIFFFQLRYIAEWRLRRNNFALIDRLWRDWSPGLCEHDSETLINAVKTALKQDVNLKAALAYYRALFKPDDIKRVQALFAKPIKVPTLTIAGELDGCIGPEHFPAMPPLFERDFELLIMKGAGHFMQHEQPQQFNAAVSDFFNKDRT